MSDHRIWVFLSNPFLSECKKNFKKGLELTIFTDNELNARQGDPFYLALYNFFHPLRVNLVTEYNDWQTQKGQQKGSTTALDNLLFKLGFNVEETSTYSKINDWDLAIQAAGAQFRKGTPDYISILPLGHKPFQTGDKDTRIEAVNSLSNALVPFAALAAVKADVDAFYLMLTSARTVQEGKIGDTSTDSDEVLSAVVAAMIGLFSVYGGLIQQYAATPEVIAALFDLELLRELPQTLFERTVPPGGEEFVAKRTLEPSRKMKLTVVSLEDVDFYMADEKNDPVRTKKVTVHGQEDEIAEVQQLEETASSTYIKIKNTSATLPAQVKIEILPEGS